MATKIVTKNSSTASAAPSASDLVQGELAVNVTDKRLYTENASGAIVELGTNPASAVTMASTLAVTGNVDFNGDLDVDGTTNLDVVDIDGAVDMASTLAVAGDANFDSGTLFVDVSANAVGIGVTNPAEKLQVNGNVMVGDDLTAGSFLDVIGAGGGDFGIRFGSEADRDAKAAILGTTATPSLRFFTNGANERFRIASDGSLSTPTAGTSNVRFGVNAGNSIASGGNYNVVVGDEAGTAITTGDQNVALGYGAGAAVTTGTRNTIVGALTGDAITTGANNEAFGYGALTTNILGSRSTAIGTAALLTQNPASAVDMYNVAVGYSAGETVTTGIRNTLVGSLAGDALTTSIDNVAIGSHALSTETTGKYSTAVGQGALFTQNVGSDASVYNTAVGYNTGNLITTGLKNTLMGGLAGDAITTGGSNVIIGYLSGSSGTNLTTGTGNVLLGSDADASASDSDYANVIGYDVTGAGGYTTLGKSGDDIRAAHGTATWATVSDQRYKKDIVDSTAGLSFINALQPRTFKYKTLGELPETFSAYEADSTEVFKNSDTNHGFIAQEIKAAIDADSSIADGFRLWDDREDGSQEVAEAALIPILVKAIQEQNALIEALTARIETLEG